MGPAAQKLLKGRGTKAIGEYGETTVEKGVKDLQEKMDLNTLKSVGIETKALKTAINNLGIRPTLAGVEKGKDYIGELAEGVRKFGIKGERQFEALVDKLPVLSIPHV